MSKLQSARTGARCVGLVVGLLMALPVAAVEREDARALSRDDGRLLYREVHYRDRTGDVARRVVLYQCPDGVAFARKTVQYDGPEPANSIVINTKTRYLYLVQGDGTAIRYGVGVGKEGFTWKGTETISAKREWPDWYPPAEMRERRPELPVMMAGGPENPLGARALYLYKDGRDTLFRIHGTPQPWTMGQKFSSGCLRLINDHAIDLYDRVPVGTPVVVG